MKGQKAQPNQTGMELQSHFISPINGGKWNLQFENPMPKQECGKHGSEEEPASVLIPYAGEISWSPFTVTHFFFIRVIPN